MTFRPARRPLRRCRLSRRCRPLQRCFALLLVSALLGGSTSLKAQEPREEPAPPRFTFHDEVSVEWVSVPVVVQSTARTRAGQAREPYLDELAADAFSLFVDGEPVPIEDFVRSADSLLGLVFYLDTSGSMSLDRRLERGRGLLSCLAKHLGSEDRAALVTFADGEVQLHAPFTVEHQLLIDIAHEATGFGNTALFDALSGLPGVASESGTARRAAVLLTDGADNASLLPRQQARELIAGAGLPVFVVDLDPEIAPPDSVPQTSASPRLDDRLSLISLATVSGGRYLALREADEIPPACARIGAELRSQYLLGFTTDPAREAALHAIEVTVKGKKRRLRHRSSYWGAMPRSLTIDRTLE